MKRTFPLLIVVLTAAIAVVLLWGSPASAQSRRTGTPEVDPLIERIQAARARDERLYGDGTTKDAGGASSGERKPAVAAKKPVADAAKEKDAEKRRPEGIAADVERSAKDPAAYAKEMSTPGRVTAQDVLKSYETDRTVGGMLDRIRGSRSEEAEKEKALREKAAKEGVTREPAPLEVRTPASDPSAYQRFLTPRRGVAGTVGGEAVLQTRQAPLGVAEIRNAVRPSGLPDPSKESTLYDTRVQAEMGVRAQLPRYADSSLLGVYETQRYDRLLTQDRDVRFEKGRANLTNVYQTYQGFQNAPDTGSSIARRDVYVPNSTTFINPTYRGSIYEVPYASDPFRRNYSSNTTDSRYSNSSYFNLGNRESYEDYYTREYGVSRSFVPDFSSSRGFEVNTIKQWTQDLRTNYGIDVRPGSATYGDLYRMRTGRAGH
jgi:hypothetical protein